MSAAPRELLPPGHVGTARLGHVVAPGRGGAYDLAWGGVVIAFPHLLFDAVGIPRMNDPEIWQCVGMIVGVYGVGYLAAAADPPPQYRSARNLRQGI